MKKNNAFEEEFSFGFITEDEVVPVKDYSENIKKIRKMIGPLLENLCNSKGDVIKWPNRNKELTPVLEEFIKLTTIEEK